MPEFESDHCPVCHKTVEIHNVLLSPEQLQLIGPEVYVPGEDFTPAQLSDEQREQRKELQAFLADTRPPELQLEYES